MDVKIPAIAIESPLIAPSISPISIAFDVPTTWDVVPIAIPLATGDWIFKILNIIGASMAPIIPLIITAIIVIAPIPFIFSERGRAIAVVMDCGNRDIFIMSLSPKSLARIKTEITAVKEPTKTPTNIGKKFFFTILIFL